MSLIDLDVFHETGYAIIDVLSAEELAHYRALSEPWYDKARAACERGEDAGEIKYPLFEPGLDTSAFHPLAHNAAIMAACEQVVGPQLVAASSSVRGVVEGAVYRQGWHRDVLQVPEDCVSDALFADAANFNAVQVNLAFYDDAAFWAVPGSHGRPNSPAEEAAFSGSRHNSPADATMPGGQPLELKAGQALIYNNNLIHRGHNHLAAKRMMFHIGYHSALRPPTWHFYNPGLRSLTPAQAQQLSPTLQAMWRDCQAVMRAYPDIAQSWQPAEA